MLVLDSTELPARERTDCVLTALTETSKVAVNLEEGPAGHVHARLDVWDFGRAYLFRNASSGIRMYRTQRQARREPLPLIGLAVQEQSDARLDQFAQPRGVAAGALMMVDLSSPFEFSWSSTGASRALMVPIDELGLPVEVVRRAATRLPASPLYRLLTSHVVDMFRDADRLSRDPFAASLGSASVDLARTLLASAAATDGRARDIHHQTLLAQVREYVRQHLRDPDLSPQRIAAAHAISVRHLYALCARADLSLEQWIISRRLDGVRDELARPEARDSSIAAVARRWGFRDPAHLTRRFTAAYGLSPRDWRTVARERFDLAAP